MTQSDTQISLELCSIDVNEDQYWLPNFGIVSKQHLEFHSNWNWIMEIKSKICHLTIVDEFNTEYDSVAKGYHCSILPAYKNSFNGFYTKVFTTEKEAVLDVIDQFLSWYEKNKK